MMRLDQTLKARVLRKALLCWLLLGGAAVQAQELLLNRSFETPVTPANGNNFYTTIPNWTVINVNPSTQTTPWNVIRPFSGYAGNPTATPTGGGAQYLDINAASGTMRQTVTITGNGMIDFSGWFSVRDFPQALSGLIINIRTSGGTLVSTVNTSFASTDPIGLWKRAAAANVPITPGTYIFEVEVPNFANVDLFSLVFKPALTLNKSGVAFSDPIKGTTNPLQIPGGITQYTITATNPGSYTVTSNSVAVIDATPPGLDLVVTDIGGVGSGPAAFVPNTSALTYSFSSLASATDRIDFSNNGGASYLYTPTANGNGVDPAVTHVRIRPGGTMAANSNFTVRLRYRVE